MPRDRGSRIRVVIADGDGISRRVLGDVLADAGIVVVAATGVADGAAELAALHTPEVVLLDVGVCDADPLDAMRRIAERSPQTRVVFTAASCQPEVGVRLLGEGARGFLTKGVETRALPRTLERVVAGEIACSRYFVGALVKQLRALPEHDPGTRQIPNMLTPREWEVLDMLCERQSTEAMAAKLVLSTETIRSHVKNMLRKLGVSSREQAIALAAELRLDRLDRDSARGDPSGPGGGGGSPQWWRAA